MFLSDGRDILSIFDKAKAHVGAEEVADPFQMSFCKRQLEQPPNLTKCTGLHAKTDPVYSAGDEKKSGVRRI